MYFRSVSSILCPSCDDIYFDITNVSLSTSLPFCQLIVESAGLCKSELYIDLFHPYPADIRYIAAPSNALMTNNGDNELLTTFYMPLDNEYRYASVIYNCYDKDLCNNNNNNNNSVVQQQYEQLSGLNYTKLEIELSELLYSNGKDLKQDVLECYNRKNKIEKCDINWYCQATFIIEQDQSDSLTTTCVPDRRPGARVGLILQSKSIGNGYRKTSLSYTCNKNQCNNPTIVHQVRQILVDMNLVDSKANNFNCASIILLIICMIMNI